jgi:hypothetical protein
MGEIFSSLDRHTAGVTDSQELFYSEKSGMTIQEYENSLGFHAKQAWLVFQSITAFVWMYRGFTLYGRVQEGWSKVKTLFVIQLITVAFIDLHEFWLKNVTGYFLILMCVTYGLFLTFSVMVDSMQDDDTAARTDGIHLLNKIHRAIMHIWFLVLFVRGQFIEGCYPVLFPVIFKQIGLFSLFNAVYFLFLYGVWTWKRENFLFNPFTLPPTSINNLRYNRELFAKQMQTYFKLILIFTTLSAGLVWMGGIVGRNSETGTRVDLVCLNGEEWAPTSIFGTVYLFFMSMMTLTQINAAQYLMIRMPYKEGVFDSEHKQLLKMALLRKLSLTAQSAGDGDNEHVATTVLKRMQTKEKIRL